MKDYTLRISSEPNPRLDTERRIIDMEYVYHYALDGQNYGSQIVDDDTRRIISQQVFDIAENLTGSHNASGTLDKIETLGRAVFNYFIPNQLKEWLSRSDGANLTLDTTEYNVPWELMHDGSSYLSQSMSFGRIVPGVTNDNLRKAKKSIHACLLGDPSSNLPGAKEEVDLIESDLSSRFEEITDTFNIETQVTKLTGGEVTKEKVLLNILLGLSGDVDILHFAGHGKFDSERLDSASLVLSNGLLKVFEVANMKISPLVFANACRTCAISREESPVAYGLLKGLAPAFMKSGASAYIGTLWPVSDGPAKRVAQIFYEEVISGKNFGRALAKAKNVAHEEYPSSATPISYVLYGDPRTRIGLFEPSLADGPYVNESGFEQIYELEKRYPKLELLLVNELPWVLWRRQDFKSWVEKILRADSDRERMVAKLYEYYDYFRKLILTGQKRFIGIVNLNTLRKYLKSLSNVDKEALCNEYSQLASSGMFLIMFIEPTDEELEEIELVSKSDDVYENLEESAYVLNRQTRHERHPLIYSILVEYNPHFIREFADKFYGYLEDSIRTYSDVFDLELSFFKNPKLLDYNKLNELSMRILEKELSRIVPEAD